MTNEHGTIFTLRFRIREVEPNTADSLGEDLASMLGDYLMLPGEHDVTYLGGDAIPAPKPPRVSIRSHVYRNREGFLVMCIFTETRASAERIRDRLRNGEDDRLEDYKL